MFVAAADVEFPSCDADTIVQRPPWFYHSLQADLDWSFPSSDSSGPPPGTGPPDIPNPNSNQPIDFRAHGVSPEYSELMLNIRMLAKTYQTAEDCSSAREYQEALTFLCSTLQRLLSLPVPVLHDAVLNVIGNAGLEPFNSAITASCRHALIIHVFAQWCGQQPDPSLLVSTAQHDLLVTLRPLLITPHHRHVNKLMLWLLSVGATCPYGPAQHKWFISHLADTAADLEIHSWDDMKAALKTVIWHEHQDDKMHRELWDEVVTMREEEAVRAVPDFFLPETVIEDVQRAMRVDSGRRADARWQS